MFKNLSGSVFYKKIPNQYNLFFLTAILLSGCGGKESPSEVSEVQRPNILWVVCEDQSPEFFPMYGDSTVRLPALEKLADQSILFQNAYSPAPVCAPARSSIITGMYPITLGTHNMRCYTPWNPQNQPEIGVQSYSPVVPEGVRPFTQYLREAGYYCTNNSKEDYNFATPPAAWDESSDSATWRNRKEGQPFFSVFNFTVTHESRIWVNGNEPLSVDPAKINVPPYFPDDPVTRHDMAVNYSNLARMDQQVGELLQNLEDDGLLDNTIIFFYSDHGGPFPRHKRALYETGLKVPLFVKFPDSEDFSIRNELVSFIDFAPTVLSLAGIEPPEHMQGKAFFGEYHSETNREYLYAASDRFDESYDRLRSVRSERFKYIKNYYPEKPYALSISYRMNMPLMQHLMELSQNNQLGEYERLWMATGKPEEEFYDLMNDPYELENLAGNPEYEEEINRHREILEIWINDVNDLGRFNELELMEEWLVDGKSQKLPTPQLEIVYEDSLKVNAAPYDATIVWRSKESKAWNIYSQPIHMDPDMDIQIKVSRIGYEESDVVTFQN